MIGSLPGSQRRTVGRSAVSGNCSMIPSTASRTCRAARSRSTPQGNVVVTTDTPSRDTEVTRTCPCTALTAFSMALVISLSISVGARPDGTGYQGNARRADVGQQVDGETTERDDPEQQDADAHHRGGDRSPDGGGWKATYG